MAIMRLKGSGGKKTEKKRSRERGYGGKGVGSAMPRLMTHRGQGRGEEMKRREERNAAGGRFKVEPPSSR